MTTSVKMMVAPEGISRKYEIKSPVNVPMKATIEEKMIRLLKSFVKRLAVA